MSDSQLQPNGHLLKPVAECYGCGIRVDPNYAVYGIPLARPLQPPEYYCKWCVEDFNVHRSEVFNDSRARKTCR